MNPIHFRTSNPVFFYSSMWLWVFFQNWRGIIHYSYLYSIRFIYLSIPHIFTQMLVVHRYEILPAVRACCIVAAQTFRQSLLFIWKTDQNSLHEDPFRAFYRQRFSSFKCIVSRSQYQSYIFKLKCLYSLISKLHWISDHSCTRLTACLVMPPSDFTLNGIDILS